MSKNTRAVKEYTREQRLVKENLKLKQELKYLRKQISRLDGDRFETLRQMCTDNEEKQQFQENINEITPSSEALKKEWACKKPNCDGYLEINIYSKLNETWYYKKCNNCSNRTKGQRYDASLVRGILKNESK